MIITGSVSRNDKEQIRTILETSGFFYPFEVNVVMELIDETTKSDEKNSGYYWLKIVEEEKILGFACFGPNPCSMHSWDLYWLVVSRSMKNKGLGTLLLQHAEEKVKAFGGAWFWIETSGRPLYQPTVAFYLRKGYTLEATLRDFYSPGDPKLIFCKKLA
jgi:GNAT superfamily N-acetyltransferase